MLIDRWKVTSDKHEHCTSLDIQDIQNIQSIHDIQGIQGIHDKQAIFFILGKFPSEQH